MRTAFTLSLSGFCIAACLLGAWLAGVTALAFAAVQMAPGGEGGE